MTVTKRNRINADCEFLKQLCKELNIQCYEFNTNSFRLNKAGKVIDFYPKSKNCFWHEAQEWGQVTDIKSFLTFEYLPKQTT